MYSSGKPGKREGGREGRGERGVEEGEKEKVEAEVV